MSDIEVQHHTLQDILILVYNRSTVYTDSFTAVLMHGKRAPSRGGGAAPTSASLGPPLGAVLASSVERKLRML